MKSGSFATILREVGRALVALAPYRDDIILVGGIVPVLYRRLPTYRQPEHPALGTTEADLSIPSRLPVIDGKSLGDLLFEAGFVVYEAPGMKVGEPGKQFFQDASHGADRPAPTYLEFLTPLRGRARDGFVEPQRGIRAPSLRYLDLLSHEPITVDVQTVSELGVSVPCPVRVPHPSMYVLQKVLARDSGRSPSKQPKDLAYAYDVSVLTQPVWKDLSPVVARARAESDEWKTWIDRALRNLDALFETETSDGTVDVARIYRDAMRSGAPSENAIATTMRRFISALALVKVAAPTDLANRALEVKDNEDVDE